MLHAVTLETVCMWWCIYADMETQDCMTELFVTTPTLHQQGLYNPRVGNQHGDGEPGLPDWQVIWPGSCDVACTVPPQQHNLARTRTYASRHQHNLSQKRCQGICILLLVQQAFQPPPEAAATVRSPEPAGAGLPCRRLLPCMHERARGAL